MPHLFDPYNVKNITLRNRIGVSPMCTYSANDGMANDWHVVHLGARAVGGAGLVITEATAVEARGRITPFDLGVWSDEQIEPLARVTHAIKANGATAGIQIAHAGRKASVNRPWDGANPILPDDPRGWQVVGASSIPYHEGYSVPHELTKDEIHEVQQAFRAGALRALQAGFEWLEIHAAHGYLIHSFYSPISNRRTDEYGGSFENRIRFLVETVHAVRSVWPDTLPLTVRLSSIDWVEDGWLIDDSVKLAQHLKNEGVDLIDCSSGSIVMGAKVKGSPGYQVPFSEAVRHGANMATAAVGLITAPSHADEIIRNERADLVLLGREMLRDPNWALHAAQTLRQPAPIPSPYLRAF